ncbi:MAG: sigma-70 family RNA polymerase sigma factor [Oscillospiraceae bacterium]|nr:sigma-70 family RNA polymerase sigma factor [Oscillospiraceae bacterium]
MDTQLMEVIYDKHKNTVYRTAFTYFKNTADAEDITSEVFIKCFEQDSNYNSDEHLKAWLIRCTINRCRDVLRSFRYKNHVSLEEADLVYETPEESTVYHAVMNLPSKYRIVIHLYYYEGYSVDEIAGITEKSSTAVQTQLYRARNKLAKILGEELDYEYSGLQRSNRPSGSKRKMQRRGI